jgi:cardiolipin synthase
MPDPLSPALPVTSYNISGIEELIGTSFCNNNHVQLLESGRETFRKIIGCISDARNFICAEFYIFRDDDTGRALADKLKEKSRQGIQVYILYDHFGSFWTSRSFWSDMETAGIHLRASHPFVWTSPRRYIYRNHKKLLVIDGVKAFTGGFNIADEYHGFRGKKYKVWRDTGIYLEGPIVSRLFDIFRESWNIWKARLIPHEPTQPAVTGGVRVIPIFARSGRARRRMRRLFIQSIHNAKNSILITTAYFMPGRKILRALEQAAKRGVVIKLLLPGKTDVRSIHYAGRAYYSRLLHAGAEIFNYQGTILHSKTAVFDGRWCIIGSTNLDFQSFRRNEESNVGLLDKDFGRKLTGVFYNDLEHSLNINKETWARRPYLQRILEKTFSVIVRKLIS